jgi:hypothetical protein
VSVCSCSHAAFLWRQEARLEKERIQKRERRAKKNREAKELAELAVLRRCTLPGLSGRHHIALL